MQTFVSCFSFYAAGMLVGVPFVAYSSGILIVYALGSLLHWRLVSWLESLPLKAFETEDLITGCVVRFTASDAFVYGDTCSSGESDVASKERLLRESH